MKMDTLFKAIFRRLLPRDQISRCLLVLLLLSATVAQAQIISIEAVEPIASEEGPIHGKFRIYSTGTLNGDIAVSYSVSGTATEGVDYSALAPSKSVNLTEGFNTEDFVNINILQDLLVEGNETVILTLTGASGQIINPAQNTATITIEDNDASVAFSTAGSSGAENVGGNLPELIINGTVANVATTVTIAVDASSSATEGADFTLDNKVISIPPAVYNNQAFPLGLTIINDDIVEDDEEIILNIVTTNGSVNSIIDPKTTTYTILNDDTEISIGGPVSLSEGDTGTTDFIFIVTRTGDLSKKSSVEYEVTGSGANGADENDFEDVEFSKSEDIEFNSGQSSKQIILKVQGDLDLEPDETFTVTLSKPKDTNIGNGTAIGTILNDDSEISLEGDVSLDEGNSGLTPFVFTVKRDGDTSGTANAKFKVTGTGTNPANAADFEGGVFPENEVNFGANIAEATITINVNGDTDPEPNETFMVTLSDAVNTTIGNATAIGTITNDDSNVISIGDNVAIPEGNSGTTTFIFTATRNTSNLNLTASATFTVSGGPTNPANAADFTGSGFPTGTVTFNSGSATSTITINVKGDTTVEPDETFIVKLSAPSTGYTFGKSEAQGTILNDDSDVMTMGLDVVQPEGNSGTTVFAFTAHRTGNNNLATTANFAVTGGPGNAANAADFAGNSFPAGQVNFPANSATGAINIIVNGDTDVEPHETFIVTLSNPGTGYVLGTRTTAQGTIQNDDANEIFIDGSVALAEGNTGTTDFNFTATRTGDTSNEVKVNYRVTPSGSNPVNAADFVGGTLPSGIATFPAGSKSAPIKINVQGDLTVEPDETFTVTLSNPPVNYILGKDKELGTIINDDSYIASIIATEPDASENPLKSGTFTVSLNTINTSGSPIDIKYDVDGTATEGDDYIALSGTVSIPEGQNKSTITVTPKNDDVVEANIETVIVSLAPGTGYSIGFPNSATVNITSDDIAGVSINDIIVDEGVGNATFTVTLNAAVPFGTIVTYATADNTAIAGSDYLSRSGTLGFLGFKGENKTISVPIIDDDVAEGTKTFYVNLVNATGFAQIVKGRGIGTITDNDNCIEAPLINANTSTIFCADFSQDLDDYNNSPIPSGFDLVWSSSDDFSNVGARRESSIVDFAASFYGYLYNEGTGCLSPPMEVTLVRNTPPEILDTSGASICGQGQATITASASDNGSLFWYSSDTATIPIGEGSSFTTPSNSTTTVYYVEASGNGCTTDRVAVTVTVQDTVDVGTTENTVACSIAGEGASIIDLDATRISGTATGVWSIVGTPPGTVTIGADNTVNFEGAPIGDYIFRFTTNSAVAPCADGSVEVTITVDNCLIDSDGDGLFDRDEILLGTDPFNPDTDGDGILDGVEVGPDVNNPLDSIGLGLIDALNPCFPNIDAATCILDLEIMKEVDYEVQTAGENVEFTITLTNLSTIMVTNVSVNELIDPGLGFQYVSSTVTQGVYDQIRGVWELEEIMGNEAHTLTIIATVPNVGSFQNIATLVDSFPEDGNQSNNSAAVTVTVEPKSNDECGFLFNMISPNGDDRNDKLFINCIQDYPNNTLQIYDRYGNEVFATRRYNNTWTGTGKNGDLPKGTYFYILDLGDGTAIKKGWLQIIR